MGKYARSDKTSQKNTPVQSQGDRALETANTPTVSQYLSNLKFKRAAFGGVDEADVWKKIEKICELYEESIYTERAERQKLDQALSRIRARVASAQGKKEDA